ncbi:MAG: hypothetical protein JWO82_2133 [Akkermansiaceae bacterium]|nr:hypothetical protein [Akkermansiaceae bacterium]
MMTNFRTPLMGLLGGAAGVAAAWANRPMETGPVAPPAPVGMAAAPRPKAEAPAAKETVAKEHAPAPGSIDGQLAFIKKARRMMFDCGEMFEVSPDGPSIGQDGTFSERALISLGIDPKKGPEIQKILDAGISRTMESMARRLKPDPWASRPERGLTAYRIAPDVDGGNALMAEMREELAGITGADAASQLSTGMVSTGQLASMGRQGLELLVETDPESGGRTVRFRYFDPMTGGYNTLGTVYASGPNRNLLGQFVDKHLPQ